MASLSKHVGRDLTLYCQTYELDDLPVVATPLTYWAGATAAASVAH